MLKMFVRKGFSFMLVLVLITTLIPISAIAAPHQENTSKISANQLDFDPRDFKDLLSDENFRERKLNHQAKNNAFISKDIDITSSNTINVIVEMVQEPVAVKQKIAEINGKNFFASSAQSEVTASQNDFLQSIKTIGLNTKVNRKFNRVFNGVSLEIQASQVPDLAKAKNVKAVYLDRTVYATPIQETEALLGDSGSFIGSTDIHSSGFTGAGLKVGVIDTGVDYLHPDLAPAYKGGYDFVDNDNDPYETTPNPFDPSAATSHGTHVSGTIVGRNVQDNGVLGIAPEADLYVYRVLGPGGSGTLSDVIAGVERAVADGMDVINLSLGSPDNDPYSPDSIALNNAMLAGVVAVVANGNDGPEKWTAGSPATSALAISVGASTIPGEAYHAEASTSLSNDTYDVDVMAWDSRDGEEGYKIVETLGDLPLVYVGLGSPDEYDGKDMDGKVALIKRGLYPFVDKMRWAKEAGAAAAIIFNSDSQDGKIGFYAGPGLNYLPTFDMSGLEGRALLDLMNNAQLNISSERMESIKETIQQKFEPGIRNPGVQKPSIVSPSVEKPSGLSIQTLQPAPTITFGNFTSNATTGDELASFSSRGPSLWEWDIKPDVVAPGVGIRSTVAAYGVTEDYPYAYELYQGTSMAAPHVAGLALLIKDAHPDFTPFDIKTALMNTAKVLDGDLAVYDQGAGRVQGLEAINTPAIAQVLDTTYTEVYYDLWSEGWWGYWDDVDDTTGSMSFGPIEPDVTNNTNYTDLRSVRVKNVSGEAQTFNVSATYISEVTGVSLSFPETVTLNTNEDGMFDVNITVTPEAEDGELQGYLYLTNDTTTLHIPFVAFIGEQDLPTDGIAYMLSDYEDVSPDDDGWKDYTDIYSGFFTPMSEVYYLLYDYKTDEYLGFVDLYISDGSIDYPQITHYDTWYDGIFYDFDFNPIQAKDGHFAIVMLAYETHDLYEIPSVRAVDIFQDTKVPQVNLGDDFDAQLGNESYQLEGFIKDAYVDLGRSDKVYVEYEVYTWELDAVGMDTLSRLPNLQNLTRQDFEPYIQAEEFTGEEGQITLNPDGSFSENIPLTSGLNWVEIYVEDAAGNYEGEADWKIIVVDDLVAAFEPQSQEVPSGEEFTLTLTAANVDKLIGADFTIEFEDDIFTLTDVEIAESFNQVGYTTQILEEDFGVDEYGYHTYKLGAAFEGLASGLSGNVPVLDLTFQATIDSSFINEDDSYGIDIIDSKYVLLDQNNVEYEASPAYADFWAEVFITDPTYSVTGTFAPQAFMTDDQLDTSVDFSTIGATVFATPDDYYDPFFNTFGEKINGSIAPDGTITIDGLRPDAMYTLVLEVPGHFRSIIDNVELVAEVEGVLVPSDVSVDFGYLYAGDVNGDDVVDIYDVVSVARYFDFDPSSDKWFHAKKGDINQDGIIDSLDFSYVIQNFALINDLLPFDILTVPTLTLPSEDK